jgi:hypothetical protein
VVPELQKGKKLQAACVLKFCPIVSVLGCGGGTLHRISASRDLHFSHEQLVDVLLFHQMPLAREQYQHHDNPYHRMFGDMDFNVDISGSFGGAYARGEFFKFGGM